VYVVFEEVLFDFNGSFVKNGAYFFRWWFLCWGGMKSINLMRRHLISVWIAFSVMNN